MFDQKKAKEIAAQDLQQRLSEMRQNENNEDCFRFPSAPINLNIYKDIEGTIDLHIHTLPCFSPRLYDDIDVALQAKATKMRAIMLKGHATITSDRATIAQKIVGNGIEVYGMICLNTPVGGMNPSAVRTALAMGAKAVWMPSMWAENHAAYIRENTGHHMGYQTINMNFPPEGKGECITGSDGKIKPEVIEILEMVAEADVMLSSGHLNEEETLMLLELANQMGIKRLISHTVNYHVLKKPLESLEKIVNYGAKLEFGWSSLSNPIWNPSNPERAISLHDCANWMRHVGVENCILTTDVGQVTSPSPIEAMRQWYELLKTEGFKKEEIDVMTKKNPAFLLNLE